MTSPRRQGCRHAIEGLRETASPHRGPARAAAIRTFLIADVRACTRFTAQHGDEAASRLAPKFAEVAGEGVEAWGGELVELRGDEALAAFDSARQALRAAVELQSAFSDEAASEPALPPDVGIGPDVGEAVPVARQRQSGAAAFGNAARKTFRPASLRNVCVEPGMTSSETGLPCALRTEYRSFCPST